jgi:hypothetical protein
MGARREDPRGDCEICNEPIWMDIPDSGAADDPAHRQHEFQALADEHLRTHPAPVQARFWLRRFLDDVRPSERAVAVRRIYTDLRALWGDQDSRGVYSIDEALGSARVYRLWLDANRCSFATCRHGEAVQQSASRASNSTTLTWHDRLVGCMFAPPHWRGTSREWRQLAAAVSRNCTCLTMPSPSGTCAGHQLLADRKLSNRLLFGRRIAARLQREEFDDSVLPRHDKDGAHHVAWAVVNEAVSQGPGGALGSHQ